MPAARPPHPPMITPEADRRLNAVLLRHGAAILTVLVLSFYAMNLTGPRTHYHSYGGLVGWGCYAVFLMTYAICMKAIYDTRLDIGRGLVRERQWQKALLALAPLDGLTQRFWDRSGETHFHLYQCHLNLGDRAKADAARRFTLRRPGPWADRLKGAPQASVKISALDRKPVTRAKGKRRRF